ncbi:MAG: helix-turn-helix domain-containing protein, partial [Candidatus Binataceae bacterium]
VPPLRERRESIAAFVAHFIEHYNRLFGKSVKYLSRAALELLVGYSWPGNVRELAHAIESAIILTDSDRISPDDLPEHVVELVAGGLHDQSSAQHAAPPARDAGIDAPTGAGPLLLDDVIKLTLVRSLEETEGNRRRAADLLGVSRSTLYRMLSRYGLAESSRARRLIGPVQSRTRIAPSS